MRKKSHLAANVSQSLFYIGCQQHTLVINNQFTLPPASRFIKRKKRKILHVFLTATELGSILQSSSSLSLRDAKWPQLVPTFPDWEPGEKSAKKSCSVSPDLLSMLVFHSLRFFLPSLFFFQQSSPYQLVLVPKHLMQALLIQLTS